MVCKDCWGGILENSIKSLQRPLGTLQFPPILLNYTPITVEAL